MATTPTPLPVPRITAPNWGQRLNNAIQSRYLRALELIAEVGANLAAEILAREASDTGELYALESKYGGDIPGSNGVGVALEGATIVVPPSDHAQVLWYSASYRVNTGGGGIITLGLYQVGAGGTAALRDYWNQLIDPNRPTTTIGERMRGRYRIAPHTDYQLYGLTFTMTRYAGSSLAMAVLNGNTDYSKTAMQLVSE